MPDSSVTSDPGPTVKSRRPAESAFKQQRLPAWQPILTAGTVLPTFFVIGIAFIPVGIGLLYFSDEVKEHIVDYTHCTKKDAEVSCADYIKQNNMTDNKCYCELELNLTEDFKAEVYFYYGLSNYYQNHRRYVKSRDDNQLLGKLNQPLSSDCDPFSEANDENGNKKPVAPCGAIANSLFNDSLSLYSQEQQVLVPVLRTGLAWNSDKQIKFRNPDTNGGSLKAAFANYTKPANWAKHVWELDLENDDNNGFQNEDLIVWMRTAALPTFRKLYRRVNHDQDGFRTGLNKGLYTVKIEYNYPVTDFDGTKSFIISTTSLLGGKNPFLGVAYVVVGTLCLLLGIILLIIHVRCSKKYYPTPTESFFLDIDTYNRKIDYEDTLVSSQKLGGGKSVTMNKPDETARQKPMTIMSDPLTSEKAVRSSLRNSGSQTLKEITENKEPQVSLKSSAATLVERPGASQGPEPSLERAGASTDVITPVPKTSKIDAATSADHPYKDNPKVAMASSEVQTEHDQDTSKAVESKPKEASQPTKAPSDVTVPKSKQAESLQPEAIVPNPAAQSSALDAAQEAVEDDKIKKKDQDGTAPAQAPSDVTVPKSKQAEGLQPEAIVPNPAAQSSASDAAQKAVEDDKIKKKDQNGTAPAQAPSDVTVPKSKQAEGLQPEAIVPNPAAQSSASDAAQKAVEDDKIKKKDQDGFAPAQAPSDVTVPKSKQAEGLQPEAIVPNPAAQSSASDAAQEAVEDDKIKKKDQNGTAPAQKSLATAPDEPPSPKERDGKTEK